MYPVTSDVKLLYDKQYPQSVLITMQTPDTTLTITESNILQNSMTIDRYCVSGETIELGSAIASELKLTLNNSEGIYDDIVFEGAELYVLIGIRDVTDSETSVHYIPCGYFTVDEPPRKLATISLSALDRMVQFDKPVTSSDLTFPTTVGNLLMECCTKCNVPLYTEVNTLLNYNFSIPAFPKDENLTYRQLIQWIGEITGTCAYIDWNGQLRLEWYTSTSTVIDRTTRYSSDIAENDITVTGVCITTDNETEYLAGTKDYAFLISNNSLIQHSHQSLAQSIYAARGGITYRPFSCTAKPLPYVYPLDKICYVDGNNIAHDSIVTNCTYKVNGATALAAKGESKEKKKYASANPLTAREKMIIKKMQDTETELTLRQQAALSLNETLANSLGLRESKQTAADGSTLYYYHDGSTLANSTIIYTFNSGGFAWTDDWNNGNPVWQYGFTRDGNALLKILSVYKLNADYIVAGTFLSKSDLSTQASTTFINGGNIITGTISADVIDTSTLKVKKIYFEDGIGEILSSSTIDNNRYVTIGSINENYDMDTVQVRVGSYFEVKSSIDDSDPTRYAALVCSVGIGRVFLYANGSYNLSSIGSDSYPWYSIHATHYYANTIRITSQLHIVNSLGNEILTIGSTGIAKQPAAGTFDLGNSPRPFDNIYGTNVTASKLYLTSSHYLSMSAGGELQVDGSSISFSTNTLKYSSSVTLTLNSSKEFVPYADKTFTLGNTSYYFKGTYTDKLYLSSNCYLSASGSSLYVNGAKFVPDANPNMSGSEVKMGGSTNYYIIANTSRELRPSYWSSYSSYYYYLGTSSYYWSHAYIGSNTAAIGYNTSSKIGFFGKTPIAQQSLSTTSTNMGYTSATASNYLTILNNIVGILKEKYGLIG